MDAVVISSPHFHLKIQVQTLVKKDVKILEVRVRFTLQQWFTGCHALVYTVFTPRLHKFIICSKLL